MSGESRLYKLTTKIQQFSLIKTIRMGLVNMIPILTIGAFALVLREFPVAAYKEFINSFANGFIYSLFNFIFSATFGVLSVFMTYTISRAYMKNKYDTDVPIIGANITSIIVFFILAGANQPDFGIDHMGPKSMLYAIIAGYFAAAIYRAFYLALRRKTTILTLGADHEFNRMLRTLFPIMITVFLFAAVNTLLLRATNMDSFHDLYIKLLNDLFAGENTGFSKGLGFIALSSLFWFFGVHGSDALEGVMQTYFSPGLHINQLQIAAGLEPTRVLTKEFFDCFVLIGGCGSALCLLVAILIFSRNRAKRGLAYTSAFPMIFNINEMMVFGLPIIYNPIMLIPFLVTPVVTYSVSYLAISIGIVPYITAEVAWTTPIFLGGYIATGSAMGSVLQLVNLIIGVLIYFPFVKLLDKNTMKNNMALYENFMEYFKANEQALQHVKLTEQNNKQGDFAKELLADIKYDLSKNLKLEYQPQYNYNGECIGVETLLRWKHPIYGMLYPPLVVKLIIEANMLKELEQAIFTKAVKEEEKIYAKFGQGIKISINVTGDTVVTDEFLDFMKKLNDKYNFKEKNFCIEVTEQTAVSFTDKTLEQLRQIKDMGLALAIDDFSMGQTSINYLKHNLFDYLKIDGLLIKEMVESENCKEIVQSIVDLANSLNMTVIAEYVELDEQKEMLHSIGCDIYQGHLYSKSLPLD